MIPRRPPLLLALLLTSAFLLPRPAAAQTAAQTAHSRADAALQSFLLKFWRGDAQYLRRATGTNDLTGYWTYANGWAALLDGVERTKGQQYYGLIETFYLGQDQRGWIVGFYDDESWMTLSLLRAYDATGNSKYLDRAKSIYADIEGGWDTTCCGAVPGGLWWDKAHTSKATAANAGAALAGVGLYRRTNDRSYLTFARQLYDFWWANMVNPSSFQVADHITTAGKKIWWKFTYNEGLMIGAGVELEEATGDATYLMKAQQVAGFMVLDEVVPTAYGYVLSDGNCGESSGDCQEFKGPAYRQLFGLYQKDTARAEYGDVLEASAEAVWNLARNVANTTFGVSWAGPAPTDDVSQLEQNVAVTALNHWAQAVGPYPGSGIPPNRYEAENATLHHLGLEAQGTGFTGWGYVAGWQQDGQWIDFRVHNASAGPRTIRFRYAAGAGTASRLVFINGRNVVNALAFPGTGSWSSYSTVQLSHDFPAGDSTVSLIFNSGLGSANWLNLDHIRIN